MVSVLDRRTPGRGGESESSSWFHSLASGLGAMTSLPVRGRFLGRSLPDELVDRGAFSSILKEYAVILNGGSGGASRSSKNLVLVAGAEAGGLRGPSSFRSTISDEFSRLSRLSRSRLARFSRSIPSSSSSGAMILVGSLRSGGLGLREGGDWPRLNKPTRPCFDMYLRPPCGRAGISFVLTRPLKNDPLELADRGDVSSPGEWGGSGGERDLGSRSRRIAARKVAPGCAARSKIEGSEGRREEAEVRRRGGGGAMINGGTWSTCSPADGALPADAGLGVLSKPLGSAESPLLSSEALGPSSD